MIMECLLTRYRVIVALFGMLIVGEGSRFQAEAIVIWPSQSQVQRAVAKGIAAAHKRIPPNRLYQRFGSAEELEPHGFLLTKLSAITVMTAHFALRSAVPSDEDLQRILSEPSLQVSVTLFGESPRFARDSYMLLKQDDRVIKPIKVRFDARAQKTRVWPEDPPYRAIVVAWFPYGAFDPMKPTTIMVFPGSGGELQFHVNLNEFP